MINKSHVTLSPRQLWVVKKLSDMLGTRDTFSISKLADHVLETTSERDLPYKNFKPNKKIRPQLTPKLKSTITTLPKGLIIKSNAPADDSRAKSFEVMCDLQALIEYNTNYKLREPKKITAPKEDIDDINGMEARFVEADTPEKLQEAKDSFSNAAKEAQAKGDFVLYGRIVALHEQAKAKAHENFAADIKSIDAQLNDLDLQRALLQEQRRARGAVGFHIK